MTQKRFRYYDIVNVHPTPFSDEDTDLIKKAFVYGAKRHKGQTRHSGEPYFSHPVAVAAILSEMDLDSETIVAAILHDVVEDTAHSPEELIKIQEEIKELFGETVLKIVLGVTKISKFKGEISKEEREREYYRNMIFGMVRDPRVILVKMADRLHNMRTLFYIPSEEKRKRIARETLEIYAPLAHRLGMGKIKAELEDLSFRYLYPEEYNRIEEKLLKRKEALEKLLKEMEERVKKALTDNGIEVEIKSRIKKPYSIYKKIKDKGVTIDEIFDLLALRVITKTEKECSEVASIIKKYWVHIPTRYRDFISNPKPNNYRAIHLTVIEQGRSIEIQIRSKEMDSIAEKGIAAHYYYKDGKVDDENIKRLILFLRDAIESGPTKEVVNKLKDELKQEFITVITPKGDFITIPKDFTVLDFAYLIHSKLGHHFKRAIVNNSVVKANRVLKDWDYVKIESDPEENPKKEWLHFVKSHKARVHIRDYLNKIKDEERVEIGKKLIEIFLKKTNISMENFIKRLEGSEFLKNRGISDIEDFYKKVSTGTIKINEQFFYDLFPKKKKKKKGFTLPVLGSLKKSTDNNERIKIYPDNKVVFLGGCCNPIKGEPIIGYLTKDNVIRVHSQSCRLLKNEILHPSRILEVDWDKDYNEKFIVKVKIIAADVFGVLFKISSVFHEEKINILKLNSKSDNTGNAVIIIEFYVNDIFQLRKIIKSIGKIKEVIDVERTR